MSEYKELTVEEIESKFDISCPVGIVIDCDQEITDEIAERAIRTYIEFHLASEEKIAAANAFWQKFHTYVTKAQDSQKDSEEFKEWQDALDRLDLCKEEFLDMKHSNGLSIHAKVEAKAA